MAENSKTHFGFKEVEAEEKAPLVGAVFSNVAARYDLMNDLMSGGLHRLWKRHFVKQISPKSKEAILDVAGGTGDIAFLMHQHRSKQTQPHPPPPPITVSDINPDMLKIGQARAKEKGISQFFSWKEANAEKLPFGDKFFDIYTIAFGIRNVTHIDTVLKEAYRVLKPGGRFYCLEFSRVSSPLMRKLYDDYSFKVIPWIGEQVANDREAYQYLVESIRQFPPQDQFKAMIEKSGFSHVSWQNLTGGTVAIHHGWKI